ncbi:MAG: hypothetical protein NC416_08455 [Eubacterium sp.]|nr:hypothetical protein [Eubacterium sp.]
MTHALDDRFWFENNHAGFNAAEIEVSFEGGELSIPAICITDRSAINVTVTGTAMEDWVVTNVKRPKDASCSEFVVSLESEIGKKYKYQVGDRVTIKVIPVEESPDEYVEFEYDVIAAKKAFVFNGIDFERVEE